MGRVLVVAVTPDQRSVRNLKDIRPLALQGPGARNSEVKPHGAASCQEGQYQNGKGHGSEIPGRGAVSPPLGPLAAAGRARRCAQFQPRHRTLVQVHGQPFLGEIAPALHVDAIASSGNVREPESSVPMGIHASNLGARLVEQDHAGLHGSTRCGTDRATDFSAVHIREMGHCRDRAAPAVNHKAGLRATHEARQCEISFRDQSAHHGAHDGDHLGLERRHGISAALLAVASDRVTRKQASRVREPAPHLGKLRCGGRPAIGRLSPRPGHPAAVRPPLWGHQDVAKMCGEKVPESVDGTVADLVRGEFASAEVDLRNGSAAGGSAAHRLWRLLPRVCFWLRKQGHQSPSVGLPRIQVHGNPAGKILRQARCLRGLLDHIVGAGQVDALRRAGLHLEVLRRLPGRTVDRDVPSVVGQVGYNQVGRSGHCRGGRRRGAAGEEGEARRNGPGRTNARWDREEYPRSWTVPGNHG